MKNNSNFSSKLASILLLTTLLFSALSVSFAFAPTVHAASGPTLTLSVSSGSPALTDSNLASSYASATTVTVTGTGFPGSQDNVLVGLVSSSSTITASTVTAGKQSLSRPSIFNSITTTSGNVMADANGYFQARFTVPQMQAGSYNVVALFTPSGGVPTMTSPAAFTINAKAALVNEYGPSNSGIFGTKVDVLYAGFAAGESITVLPINLMTAAWHGAGGAFNTFTAGTDGASDLSGAAQVGYIADRPGGTLTITLIGTTSSTTVTTTFTLTPSLEFATNGGVTTLTIPSGTSTARVMGHNFAAQATISANSITLNGGSAIMGSVTTTTIGTFPTATQFTYTTALGQGIVNVVFNGTTYNFANGNIVAPTSLLEGDEVLNSLAPTSPLLASTTTSGVAYFTLDATSHAVEDTAWIFATGGAHSGTIAVTFTRADASTPTITLAGTTGGESDTISDAQGGWVAFFTVPAAFGSANVLSLSGDANFAAGPTNSLAITPAITSATPSKSSYNIAVTPTLSLTGFKQDTTVTVTIGGVVWGNPLSPAWTASTYGSIALTMSAMPAVAGGSQTLTVSGTTSGNTASLTATVKPIIPTAAISPVSSPSSGLLAGQTITLSSSATGGVQGLAASTAYTLMFDGPSGTNVGTFTSTSSGTLPVGVQLTLPAGSTGWHIVDFTAAGVSAIYAGIVSTGQQYTNLLVYMASSLTVLPSAGTAGTTVTVSGSALSASTSYAVQVNSISYATFTSTATGAIPASTTFAFPNVSVDTCKGAANGNNLGQSCTINVITASGTVASAGLFLLQAGMSLSPTAGAAGSSATASASGLSVSNNYNIVWDAALTSQGITSGIVVGTIVPLSDGTGSATFTIPANAASGVHSVSLVIGGLLGTTGAVFQLITAPTFNVGGVTGAVGTSTLTPSGTPAKSTTGPTPAITASFTNTLSTSLTVYMWVSVTNSAGQSVGVLAGGATIGAGQTVSIPAPINLPSGSYTGTVFCTTSSGVVISTTSASFSFSV